MCPPTIEEVALAFEYLADLKGPDFTHPWVGGVKHEGLHGAAGRPRGEDELAGVALHVLLQTQTAHLQSTDTAEETFDWSKYASFLFDHYASSVFPQLAQDKSA